MSDNDLKILIVDDEPNIRTGLAKGLQAEAEVIDVASSGEEGLQKFLESEHEIVITDLRLSGELDGLQLVAQIHDRHPETHVIVITAHGTVETAVEAMRCGAFDFVTKPIDLNVVPIHVPPLRDRREDIPLLVESFLAHFCQRHRRPLKQVAPEAMRALIAHSWADNIRQLRNFVERLVVTTSTDIIHAADLPIDAQSVVAGSPTTLAAAVEAAEKQAILAALAACDFHRERTAELLDVSVHALHYKMNRYGLH